jgi:hypothetical protein
MVQDSVSFAFDKPGISFNFPVEPSPIKSICGSYSTDSLAPSSEVDDRIPVRLSDEPVSLTDPIEHNCPVTVPVPQGTNGSTQQPAVVPRSCGVCFSF